MRYPALGRKAEIYQPIAIVGIGCRFPGGVDSATTFWDLLIQGRDGTREVPADRWSLEKYYDPNPEAVGKIYTKRGGFLNDVSGFDPQFFGISPREAAYVDPQQRLLLETTWEAFEDAGIAPRAWAGRKVGIFVGLFTHDYENIHMRVSERGIYGPHSAIGMSTTIAANRLSHAFDFKGPSMVIDTACSSSLVAVHLACRSLQAGETDLAVAGGVNLQLTPEMTMSLCKASMLSPDGRCKTFDARANGYARADGVGMVVFKTLANALADGDAIYAVIRGSAVNQDGRSKGLTVPNGEAQKRVMRDALACAGVSPTKISYVEAHGTGTPVGDPIEANALGSILSERAPQRAPCAIGSVKSNFGHTESAAGIAGLIKVALMQRHGMIPANLHFETPSPDIPFERLRLRVPTVPEQWPLDAEGHRLAGVNSFGFGGTNAHLVVANAPGQPEPITEDVPAGRPLLVCLSGRSDEALRASALAYRDLLRTLGGAPLPAIAAQLALGREHHPIRLTAAGESRGAIAELLDGFAADIRRTGVVTGKVAGGALPGLVFVCSGMGQQWWSMGRGLLEREPVFAAKIAELDELFRRLDPAFGLRDILIASETNSEIDRTENAQPAIFSLQVGLAALWASWGVRPDAIVGHSIGEVAAACIAGALSLEDAVTVCFHRSRLQATLAGRGGMLAVGLPADAMRDRMRGVEHLVAVAAVNSRSSVTLAGDSATLEQFAADLENQSIFARILNVEVPYHSPVMDEIAVPFMDALAGISPRAAVIPLVSTVTGTEIDGETLDAAYWNRNIREAVSFATAIELLIERQCGCFVEIGAHPVLAASIGECLAAKGASGTTIASLRRKQDDTITFLGAVGQLHCQGYALDFAKQFTRPSVRVDLPKYPWQRSRFWAESAESRKLRTGLSEADGRPDHPLLGERLTSPQPMWRNEVSSQRPHFLQDHRVQGSVVFPAAGYIEMALAAACETGLGEEGIAFERFSIEAPLVLDATLPARLQLSLGNDRRFQIHSLTMHDGEQRWTRHASGCLVKAAPVGQAPELDWTMLDGRLPTTRTQAEAYRRTDQLGLQYGPQFQLLETLWVGADEALARIAATSEISAEASRYKVHPAVLDAAFHLMAALPTEGTYLPVGVERIEVYRPGVVADWAYVRKVSQSRSRIVVDVSLADEEGRILVAVSGLACQLFDDAKVGARNAGRFLYDQVWVESPSTDGAIPRPAWFIPSPTTLAPALQQRHDLRNADSIRERFVRQALPALDELATGYFIAALSELGFDWHDSNRFALDELSDRLGIAPRHRRLVAQIVAFLDQSGYLAQDGALWRVRTRPPIPTVAAQWRSLVLTYPDCHAELVLMQRCGPRLAELLRDEIEPLAALFPVGSPIAEQMYTDSPTCGPYNRIIADAVTEIVRQLPEGETLRVLEVGAGTGGLTALLLPLLPAGCTSYVMSDVSHGFINQAKDRFRAFPFVRYEILDADKDPIAGQGFDEGAFDLIVICDALHACADLRTSLGHLRRLLAPNGVLAMMELTTPPRSFDLIFGLLPGWWAFTDADLRPQHATLPAAGWLSLLANCGFEAGVSIADRIGGADSLHSVLLAQKPVTVLPLRAGPVLRAPSKREPDTPIILLADALGIAAKLAAELRSLGHPAILCGDGSTCPTEANGALRRLLSDGPETNGGGPVVVDLRALAAPDRAGDAVRPSVAAIAACANLLHIARDLNARNWQGKPDLWVVTNGTEAIGAQVTIALEQAPLRGFARVLRNEHAELNTYLVDLSAELHESDVAALAREIVAANVDEDEIALRGHRRFVSRMIGHRNLRETGDLATAFRLSRARQAGHDGLSAREVAMPIPGPGQMMVQVRAAGLNFKDFARHAGLIDPGSDGLGLEGAGIVTAVGDGVTQFAPGDHVMGLMKGSLSNPTLTNARVIVRKPEILSFEEAAGIPIAYLSAYYALKKQARIAPGESVLIHTAAGGLGLAALQVARAFGATVFATAGNDEKRDYLRACGASYVGDSRSATFADEILRLTGGKGVDVVINTLPAEMNQANIRILTPGGGRLIDLSNVYYGAQLDYETLKRGIQFSAFDLSAIADDNPDLISTLLAELVAMFESGVLRPIPYRRVPIDRVSEALRNFRKAAHIGKVVVSLADGIMDITPTASAIALRADASYLISGGLSGFGLSTAKWLVEQGAKHLVLVGRRGAVSPEAIEELAELREAGTEVHAVAADVADAQQMQALLARFGRDFPPLHGIVHSAMVLHDVAIRDMTLDQLSLVIKPKIDGAWNLHRFSLDQPLDFFICYSSLSAVLGNRDQANYAAANEYLEALARFRRAGGRPALAIGWGAIGGAGFVARDAAIRDTFSRQGVFHLGLDQAWAAISLGLRCGIANLYAGVFDWSTMRQFSRGLSSPRFSLIDPGYSGDKEVQGASRVALDSTAAPEQRLQQLHDILVREISDVLGIDPQTLDEKRPLIELGFDSLMAVELIVAIEQATGYGFSRMGLLRPGVCTAELIAEAAAALGGQEVNTPSEALKAAPAPTEPADSIRIEDLSEREVDALLSELDAGE